MDIEQQYIVYMLVKDSDGVLEDIPLRPFPTPYEAQLYIEGYLDAVINHTGTADYWTEENILKERGQFSIKDIGGKSVDKNNKEEAENG